MKCIKHKIECSHAYLLPISDLHIGDKNFDKKKLRGYLDWVKKTKNARVFLNGDILNVATKDSVSSTFDQNMDLATQIDVALALLKPIKGKIIGCISGNHEQRMEGYAGYNPLIPLCASLGIPFLGYSAIVAMKIVGGKFKREKHADGDSQTYTFYCHHTTGGGGHTVGGKMNRVELLKKLVDNCDVYIGSHNHQLGVMPVESRHYQERGNKIIVQRQLLIDSGSFLSWDGGYAEKMQLPPAKLGAVRIRMDGTKRDIHCDL